MKSLFAKTNLSTWILVGTIAGFLALPLSGNGGLLERFSHLAPVEYEADQTLAHVLFSPKWLVLPQLSLAYKDRMRNHTIPYVKTLRSLRVIPYFRQALG